MKDQSSIRSIKGVGEKTEPLFHKIGVRTREDLLHYYPRNYDIFQPPIPTSMVREGEICAVEGIVTKTPERKQVRKLQVISAPVRDNQGILWMSWFNMPFLQKTLKPGNRFVFRGKVSRKTGKLVMEQPKIYSLADYDILLNQMQPVYGLTEGLTNAQVTKAVRRVLEESIIYKEYLPEYIRKKYQLAEYNFAIESIHFPKNKENLMTARKRLVFEELFIFILALRRIRSELLVRPNAYVIPASQTANALLANLPYTLTGAQKKALEEIRKDLNGEKPMNRLVQGDVGSGKTILAVLSLLDTACAGYQGAIMVPTEVLARQHFESFTGLFAAQGIDKKVILLTGSMTAKEKRTAYEQIASGEASIVVGTHALIQDIVRFDALALVVTDEQHRFGVNQRELLSKKGKDEEFPPHILVMSATPIPRTLAIILYGDLDISVIDELPANRLPIKNCVVNTGYREKAYLFIKNEVKRGRQAYIICPMVEESEQMEAENVTDYTEMLKEKLPPDIYVECLHGRMKAKEKNEIMEAFAQNRIQILVSTTVIEVGVNVPNTTVMMVENAERFGLAQLHQLRGRVGRGKEQSYCIFVSTSDKKETMERLEILNQSNDGFYIANEDLKLRGPGDLFGIRQSGEMLFRLADIYQDANVLKQAADAAGELQNDDPDLEEERNRRLRDYLEEYISKTLGNLNL